VKSILIIGMGGFIGAVLRYAVSGYVQTINPKTLLPVGTLAVNLIGCFLIGFLATLAETRGALTPDARLFWLIGVLGAFTTFSTFGYETLALLRDGQNLLTLLNVGLQVMVGLFAVWAGSALVRAVWGG
jgi:CrcB protein